MARLRHLSPAWFIWILSLIMIMATTYIVVTEPELPYDGWGFRGFPSAIALPVVSVGLLIVLRHRRHGVGWLLLLIGLTSAIQGMLFEYGLISLFRYQDRLPGATTVAWFLNWYWIIIDALAALVLIHMPNGRLPSTHWRPLIRVFIIVVFLGIILTILTPGKLNSSFPAVTNPTGLQQLEPFSPFLSRSIPGVLIIFMMGSGAISLIGRYRRSQGVERQQLKWLAFAGFLVGITAPANATNLKIGQALFILASFCLPLAIGVAILRYRLYDIDIIIRRSLVYGLLTILLVGVYFGAVVLLQTAFTAVTGQESPVAIVISTLIIAALFNPLRQRLQAFIDRRFFRSKYDAGRTLAQFAQTARDEVSIEALAAELNRVIKETMQPQITSFWFRNVQETESSK